MVFLIGAYLPPNCASILILLSIIKMSKVSLWVLMLKLDIILISSYRSSGDPKRSRYQPRCKVYSILTSQSKAPSITYGLEMWVLTFSGLLGPILLLRIGKCLDIDVVLNLISVTLKSAFNLFSFKFNCPIGDLATPSSMHEAAA